MTNYTGINPRTGKRRLRKADNFQVVPTETRAHYTGRFCPDHVKAVIKAAAPIPAGRFTIVVNGNRVSCSRSTAIVRWLETIDFTINTTRNDLAASKLAKRLHAISAAAATSRKLLLDGIDEGSVGIPIQVQNVLWSMADKDGYPDPDSRIQEIIDAIDELKRWSENAKMLARSALDRDDLREVPARKLGICKEDHAVHVLDWWWARRREQAGIEVDVGDRTEWALAGILSIWKDVLNKKVKMAVRKPPHPCEELPYGKLIAFSLACLRLLGLDRGPDGKQFGEEAVRGRIRRMLDRRTEQVLQNRGSAIRRDT